MPRNCKNLSFQQDPCSKICQEIKSAKKLSRNCQEIAKKLQEFAKNVRVIFQEIAKKLIAELLKKSGSWPAYLKKNKKTGGKKLARSISNASDSAEKSADNSHDREKLSNCARINQLKKKIIKKVT